MGSFWQAALEFVFPPLCLHCQEDTYCQRSFCKECIDTFSLFEREDRCSSCFSPISKRGCIHCDENPLFYRQMAAFPHEGAPATLVQELKKGKKPYLAKDAAAFMLVQWEKFSSSLPDLIVPVPQTLNRYLEIGYNPSLLLAKEMGKWMDLPVADLLQRKSGGFLQASLTRELRGKLSSHGFGWKERRMIADLHILLIDDVIGTGKTISHCAALLQQGCPAKIEAITFTFQEI